MGDLLRGGQLLVHELWSLTTLFLHVSISSAGGTDGVLQTGWQGLTSHCHHLAPEQEKVYPPSAAGHCFLLIFLIMGSMVAQWLTRWPHSMKIQALSLGWCRASLCGVCMGFPWGLRFPPTNKKCVLGSLFCQCSSSWHWMELFVLCLKPFVNTDCKCTLIPVSCIVCECKMYR